jgi:uncharacterized oligopeptide transporter (OPT) family protein
MKNIQWGNLDREEKVSVFWQYITAGVFQSMAVCVLYAGFIMSSSESVAGAIFFFFLSAILFAGAIKIFKDIEA